MVAHKNFFYENSTTFVILIMHKDLYNYLCYKSGLIVPFANANPSYGIITFRS